MVELWCWIEVCITYGGRHRNFWSLACLLPRGYRRIEQSGIYWCLLILPETEESLCGTVCGYAEFDLCKVSCTLLLVQPIESLAMNNMATEHEKKVYMLPRVWQMSSILHLIADSADWELEMNDMTIKHDFIIFGLVKSLPKRKTVFYGSWSLYYFDVWSNGLSLAINLRVFSFLE